MTIVYRKRALPALGLCRGVTRRALLGGTTAAFLSQSFNRLHAASDSLVFEHAFGTSVLDRPAERVVSLGYTTQDPLLALGIAPLAIRQWFGNFPHGVWPWAQAQLGEAKPELLVGEVSMERVAALKPDLIVAIGSGISKAEYRVLSRIAPVLMHEAGDAVYGTAWDKMTRMVGRATGKSNEAEALISRVQNQFATARARHPDWARKTAVAGYHWGGETGAFTGADTRAAFLAELGFKPTAPVLELSGPAEFYARLSPEDLSPLDADVLVWVSSFEQAPDLVSLPMRKTLSAHREGREVFAGGLMAAAMSFGSVLSLPFLLDHLEADIAAAADGDTQTIVMSAEKAGLLS